MKLRSILLLLAVIAINSSGLALAKENNRPYSFSSARKTGQIDAVTVQLEVGGDVKDVVGGKEDREKMSVRCSLAYDEKTLLTPGDGQNQWRSVRHYRKVETVVNIGKEQFKPALRPERTLVAAEIGEQKSALFSPRGPLTREELDLLDLQGNSLLLDALLPEKPVAAGESWKPAEKILAQLLGLDEIGQSDVQCSLKSVAKEAAGDIARFEIAGKLSGAVLGVTSEIEILGKFRFDMRRNRIDWLGLLIKEQRQSSPVTDGLDTTAKLSVAIVPADQVPELSDDGLKDVQLQSTPELLQLSHASKDGGWEIAYDREWNINRNMQDKIVMRRIERGDQIAQCNLSSLQKREPDKVVALEEFQEDIKKALDKDFKEFVEAAQSVDPAGRRVLRVVARGTASDLPIRWIYYHLADRQGRQAAFVFTVEEKFVERFDGADQKLVQSLKFME
jgi:hypothetical protein